MNAVIAAGLAVGVFLAWVGILASHGDRRVTKPRKIVSTISLDTSAFRVSLERASRALTDAFRLMGVAAEEFNAQMRRHQEECAAARAREQELRRRRRPWEATS